MRIRSSAPSLRRTPLAALLLTAAAAVAPPPGLTLPIPAAAASPAITIAAAPPFTGTYNGKTDDGPATLKLNQDGSGNVTGTLTLDGETLTLKGRVESEGRVVGTVSVNGMDTPLQFEVRRQGDTLRFNFLINGAADEEPIVFPAKAGSGDSTPAPTRANEDGKDTEDATPAAAGSGSFIGTFKGAQMTVTIKAGGSAGAVSGTIKMGEQSFPLTAKVLPQGIEGTFESGGDRFEFRAALQEGRTLLFNTDGTTHMLVRQGGTPAAPKKANPLASGGGSKPKPANPLASKSGGPAAAISSGGAASTAGGGTYRFPTGLSFRYPKGWTAKEAAGGDVMLTPPGASPQAEGYQVLTPQFNDAIAQAGLKGDDPRLAGVVDGLMQKIAPNLRRVGDREAVTSGGQPGSVFTYEGTGTNGQPARARVRIAIHENSLTGIFAVGEKDRVAARDKAIQAVFESFSTGAAAIDPQLVGTWMGGLSDNGQILKGVGGRTTGTTASDSQTRYVLSADGTLTEITRSRTIVIAGGASLDSGDTEEKKTGRWSAADGRLSLTLNGSTVSVPYRIQGNTLILTLPDGKTTSATRVQ